MISYIIVDMMSGEVCKALHMLGRGTKLFIPHFASHMCHNISALFPVRIVKYFMFPFTFSLDIILVGNIKCDLRAT
jgi:hypothetical protein